MVAVAASLAGASPAFAERAMPADAFTRTVGVNTHVMFHNTPYKDLGATIEALQWLGVRHVRDGVEAPAPPRGTWYRGEQVRRYNAMARAGMRLTLIAGGPDREGDTLAARLGVVRRLSGVVAVEAPNEWDLNGGSDWATTLPRHQRDLYAGVKADAVLRRRGVRVYGPSFGRLENAAAVGDLSDAMDVGNLHAYSGGRMPEDAEPGRAPGEGLPERLRLARELSGSKPMVLTEVGFHNADRQPGRMPPSPEEVAAIYTVRMVLEHARLGIARTYIYELYDAFRDPLKVTAESNFGLFTHGGDPKPAATALRRLLRLTRDTKRSPRNAQLDVRVEGGGDQLRTLLIARSGGRYALALWRAKPIWDPDRKQDIPVAEETARVTLPTSFATVRARRPAELDDPAERWSDTSTIGVGVGAAPVVLELTPGKGGAGRPPMRLPRPFF